MEHSNRSFRALRTDLQTLLAPSYAQFFKFRKRLNLLELTEFENVNVKHLVIFKKTVFLKTMTN